MTRAGALFALSRNLQLGTAAGRAFSVYIKSVVVFVRCSTLFCPRSAMNNERARYSAGWAKREFIAGEKERGEMMTGLR